ncbi:MAG: hypothetical protein QOF27_730 [Gaiellaceae bacterium]|nr:hypothetical protein [Gaiellaceae bacterium]
MGKTRSPCVSNVILRRAVAAVPRRSAWNGRSRSRPFHDYSSVTKPARRTMVQSPARSACQRATRSGSSRTFSSRQSWQRRDPVRPRGAWRSLPQARQWNSPHSSSSGIGLASETATSVPTAGGIPEDRARRAVEEGTGARARGRPRSSLECRAWSARPGQAWRSSA